MPIRRLTDPWALVALLSAAARLLPPFGLGSRLVSENEVELVVLVLQNQ